MPFIASIVIGTIQLGATVDYAILMTTRYKKSAAKEKQKKKQSLLLSPLLLVSVIVSGLRFTATFGVGFYSDIDMISALCSLMARGAIISMLTVIFILPSALMVFDKVICSTTKEMNLKKIEAKAKKEASANA